MEVSSDTSNLSSKRCRSNSWYASVHLWKGPNSSPAASIVVETSEKIFQSFQVRLQSSAADNFHKVLWWYSSKLWLFQSPPPWLRGSSSPIPNIWPSLPAWICIIEGQCLKCDTSTCAKPGSCCAEMHIQRDHWVSVPVRSRPKIPHLLSSGDLEDYKSWSIRPEYPTQLNSHTQSWVWLSLASIPSRLNSTQSGRISPNK